MRTGTRTRWEAPIITTGEPAISVPPPAPSPLAAAALLRLLQLCSPALPIGAFAYSQGLEPAVAAGWVRDEATARAWILGLLAGSVGALDLPVLARLHAAWGGGDVVAARDVRRWSALLRASRPSAELQAEDRHLARALARVIEDQGAPGAARFADDPQATYAAVFARAAIAWGIPVDATLAGFAFAWVEAQVGAALRAIPLGQTAGQRILAAGVGAIPAVVARALALDDDDLGASAPAHAIASARHETQYSRLFRS